MVRMKKVGIVILLGSLILAVGTCGTLTKNTDSKYLDVNGVVREAFLTDKGFSAELSKHMTEEVFDKINIFNCYPVNSPEFKKPFKVDFSLREISQKKENDRVKVEMVYSVMIYDSNNKTVGGSKHVPITLTVEEAGSGWLITNKEEQA